MVSPPLSSQPRGLSRFLRRLRTWLVTAFSLSCIGLALSIGLVSVLLPLVERYPDQVADWLARRSGLQIEIDAVHGRWEPRGPVLGLSGLRLGEPGAGLLALEHGELAVDFYALLLRRGPRSELRLSGLDLDIRRAADGRLRLAGIGRGAGDAAAVDPWRWLGRLGALRLVDVRLHLSDQASAAVLTLGPGELLLREEGGALWVDAQLTRAGADGRLQLRAEALLGDHAGAFPVLQRAHLVASQLEIPAWLDGLPLPVDALGGRLASELWLDLRSGRELVVDLLVEDLRLAAARSLTLGSASGIRPRYFVPQLEARLRLESPSAGHWAVWMESAAYERLGRRVIPEHLEYVRDAGGRLRLQAAGLPLDDLAALALLLPLPAPLAEWLHDGVPRGWLTQLELERAADGDWAGTLAAEQLGWLPLRALPGVAGLALSARFDAAGLLAKFDAPAGLEIDSAGLFRAPLRFERADGAVVFAWDPHGDWNVQVSDVQLEADGAAIELEGAVWPEGGKPRLDLHARILQGSAEVAKRYWPVRVMPPETVQWLDRNLLAGTVVSGRASFSGRPADWPFDGTGRGRFEAIAEIVDGELRFHDRWGGGRAIHALARFVDNAMDIRALSGQVDGQAIDYAAARIADFREPVLELDVTTAAEAGRTLDWLRRTPIHARVGGLLFGLSLQGPITLATEIRIPLKRSLGPDTVRGEVDLLGIEIFDVKWGLRLERSHGRLSFTENGLRADALRGLAAGEPVVLDLAFGAACSDPRRVAEVRLRGPLAAEDLLALRPELDWLQGRLPGVAHWDLDFALDAATARGGGGWQLALASDLLGVAIDLPEPLGKPAGQARRLFLNLQQAAGGFDLNLGLAELLGVAARWADGGPAELALRLGAGQVQASGQPGLRVLGRLDGLQLAGWPLPGALGAAQGLAQLQIDLDVGQLRIGASDLGAVHARSVPGFDQGFALRLEGPAVSGDIALPSASGEGWIARLEHLDWPLPERSRDVDPAEPPPLRPLTRMLPSQAPAIRIQVEDLKLGGQPIGRLNLIAAPRGDDWRVDELSLSSSRIALDASGDWARQGASSRSRFSARLDASDPGGLLRGLGYAAALEGGQARLVLNAVWPGGPQDFALRRLLGELDLDIQGGRVRDVQPGAGRLLGLFSLTEIPRRLSLDFGDFFQQGLAINAIRGRFHLEAGAAFTDSLVVLSPAAEVQVRGRTGLVTRDYDQEMLVLPAIGGGLPLIGALTAGPAGAAAGWVMQGMLNDPLRRAAAQRYHISGSWSAPHVEPLERARPSAGSRP